MRKTLIVASLVAGTLLVGSCGEDRDESAEARRVEPRQSPAAGIGRPPSRTSEQDTIRRFLEVVIPDATPSQLECATSGIIRDLGYERWQLLLRVGVAEKKGHLDPADRSPQLRHLSAKNKEIAIQCGLGSG